MSRRHVRGQAVTELALGTLVFVPTLVLGIFLAETATFKLEAIEAATEPLWDATAYSQQKYEGGTFVQSPGAIGAALGRAQNRMKGRAMVFTQASAPQLRCGSSPDMSFTVGGVPLEDNRGISCEARMAVNSKELVRNFADQGREGFFKEPLSNIRRQFDFCENRRCTGFKMAIGDWGMVRQGTEPEECRLTMDGCENGGFFAKAKATYEQNQGAGTLGDSHKAFMRALMDRAGAPADYDRVTDFQMSYQGEADFEERVPVSEGDEVWYTTPYISQKRREAYQVRAAKFLGRP